jgi:hypothetical protein
MANTNVTSAAASQSTLGAMNYMPIGCNMKWTIPYTLVATGTGSTDTVTVALGNTPTTWVIDKALVRIRTAFAGTGTQTFSLTVGTTTTTNACIASADLIATGVAYLPPAAGVPVSTNLTGTASKALVAVITNAAAGSPSAITAGELDLYLNVVDGTKLG